MSPTTYLITGSTGDTGRATIVELLSRGHRVRAMAHRKDERSKELESLGAEVVFGDFLNLDDVRAALRGVKGAYFCYPIRPGIVQASAYFAQAAKEAGVEAIVNMSQISARQDAASNAARDHWIAERVFDWSGLDVSHLRPTYFAEWLLYMAPMARTGLIAWPFSATGRHAPIAAEDQARVIAAILQNPAAHRNKVYPLFGAVEMTPVEIAQSVGSALGKEIRYQEVPLDMAFQAMGKLLRDKPVQHTARMMYGEFEQTPNRPPGDSFLVQHLKEVAIDHRNGLFAGMNDIVERIGGRPPMTVQQFAEKNRSLLI